jgi:antitoxin (DNA-binding transcriptional repressor) of toxin-antitoxin stability system
MKKTETQISASEFKKCFLNLVDDVKNNNNSFVITKRKIPVAKVVPLDKEKDVYLSSLFGFMQGSVKLNDDIVEYSSEDDWEINHE